MMMAMMMMHFSNQEECIQGLQKMPVDPAGRNKSTSLSLERCGANDGPIVPAVAHFREER